MSLAEELERRLKGKVLLIGAGNTLRGDDGAGPAVIAMLEGSVSASLLDVGETPESYCGKILETRPDAIVFIDAADFGASPGEVAFLETDDMAGCGLSTHQMPIELFFRYLRAETGADMFGIGIQPAETGFGEPMSPPVSETVGALAELLQSLLPRAPLAPMKTRQVN